MRSSVLPDTVRRVAVLDRTKEPGAIGDPALYTRDLLTALLDTLLISIGLLTLLFAPDYLVPRKLPAW